MKLLNVFRKQDLLTTLAWIDLTFTPFIFVVPGIATEHRFSIACMYGVLAINAICVGEVINFLDYLRRRLGA